jgi:hypothetical protein
MDSETLIADILRAIAAGEVPTIDLTNAGNVTIIAADVFLAIAAAGVDVVVVLPSGFTYTIIASSITDSVGAFDLNIAVYIEHTVTQHTTIGGGIVDIAANSLVFKPNFHGEFGFELVFNVTAEQLDHVGIDGETAKHFHVCAVGEVTEQNQPAYNSDGSVDMRFSHASFHVLSNEVPITVETGSLVSMPGEAVPGVVEETSPGGGDQGGITITPLQEALAQQSANSFWLLIVICSVVILGSAGATVVMLKRRNTPGPA